MLKPGKSHTNNKIKTSFSQEQKMTPLVSI